MGDTIANRYLGLDYGTKTVGVAVCDALGITAQGVEIIRRERPTKLRRTLARIEELIEEYQVTGIVLGLPLHLNYTQGERASATLLFADELMRRCKCPIYLWDERLTSVESHDTMNLLGLSMEKQKQIVDEMAAMLILQGFLDRINAGGKVDVYEPSKKE